jgi:2-polyprenyl-3-methyl-5-hydroxy-6-metoxy-1,4-benzoquinol methylase
MQLSHIDNNTAFDWGKTSADYAKYRDIYPPEFYDCLFALGIGTAGQTVLDVGTGTGVLPRHMHRHGAKWVGADISPEQIQFAQALSQGMDIAYIVSAAEDVDFPDATFDAVTALQCFIYIDPARFYPLLGRILKPHGIFAEMTMNFLPFESEIVSGSESLILKYNPQWTGGGFRREGLRSRPDQLERLCGGIFEVEAIEMLDLQVPFTRESWHGRMKTIRGISASSLSPEQIKAWSDEHWAYMQTCPEQFTIPHVAKIHKLRLK